MSAPRCLITVALGTCALMACEPDHTRPLEESERGVVAGDSLSEVTGTHHVVQSVAGNEPGESEIVVDGVVVAAAPGPDDQPLLLDDERSIVFVSGRTGVASLWRVSVDGSALAQLTNVGLRVGALGDTFVPPPARQMTQDGDAVVYDDGYGGTWRVPLTTTVAPTRISGEVIHGAR
jgi:hypothetical protein